MPHRPGHGTQRRRIERQSRGETARPISKGAQQASNTALVNAETRRLENYIRDNPPGENRNREQSSIEDIVKNSMPKKFQDNFDGVTSYKDMNQAQKALFSFYNDGRNKYQRDMNTMRTSSPESMQAYAQKFPLTQFAMDMSPTVMGAIMGIPLGAIERGIENTKKGYNFGKRGLGLGLDSLKTGIDKGMGAAERGLNSLTGKAEDAIDIFQDAIAKREGDNTFTVQSRPGPGGGASFREDFLIDTPSSEESLNDFFGYYTDPATRKEFEQLKGLQSLDPQFYGGRSPTDDMYPRNFNTIEGDPAALGRQYNQMDKDNQLNFNTQNQVDPNNQFDVAELTPKQIDFMRNPMQSLDFQSRDSLFNKVKQLEDKGFLGFGAQEPTTREEFEQFINSGGIQTAANGGMMEKGIASLNSPEYQRLMSASNFGF